MFVINQLLNCPTELDIIVDTMSANRLHVITLLSMLLL